MPTLTGSLLGLSSLFDSLSGLAPVKKHLFRASREMLLAVQGLLEVADQYVQSGDSPSNNQQAVRMAIVYAQKTVKGITQQLPRGNDGDDEEYRILQRKVMGSILDVLEGEIRKGERGTAPKQKMKVEVLQAIRNVLLKEMYGQEKGL
jgi:hypothetical protein